jgi:hypothetical protein
MFHTYLYGIKNIRGVDPHPQLKAINEGTTHILAGHFIDVSKGFQKSWIGFVWQ